MGVFKNLEIDIKSNILSTVKKYRSLAENDSGNLTYKCDYCHKYNLIHGNDAYDSLVQYYLNITE